MDENVENTSSQKDNVESGYSRGASINRLRKRFLSMARPLKRLVRTLYCGDRKPLEIIQIGYKPHPETNAPPFLKAAKKLGMKTTLIGPPGTRKYYREVLKAEDCDRIIEVKSLESSQQMSEALERAGYSKENGKNLLFIAELDPAVKATYELSRMFTGSLPGRTAGNFIPLDKVGLRKALDALTAFQPKYCEVKLDSKESLDTALAHVGFPSVLKAANGTAGKGIVIVTSKEDLYKEASILNEQRNEGGEPFSGFLLEEKINGPEYSIQGIVRNGVMNMLNVCDKVVGIEGNKFVEQGHIARSPNDYPSELKEMAKEVIKTIGYNHGPFQMDVIKSETDGKFKILEIGHRLSGMSIQSAITERTGKILAAETIAHFSGIKSDSVEPEFKCAGVMKMVTPEERKEAEKILLKVKGRILDDWLKPNSESSVPEGHLSYYQRHQRGAQGTLLISGNNPEEIRDCFSIITEGRKGQYIYKPFDKPCENVSVQQTEPLGGSESKEPRTTRNSTFSKLWKKNQTSQRRRSKNAVLPPNLSTNQGTERSSPLPCLPLFRPVREGR